MKISKKGKEAAERRRKLLECEINEDDTVTQPCHGMPEVKQ